MIAKIIAVILLLISLGISIGQHGTPKEGNNNAWFSFTATLIWITLLYFM